MIKNLQQKWHCGAMGTRAHFKNGASPKSQASRGSFFRNSMFKKIPIFLLAPVLTLGCDSAIRFNRYGVPMIFNWYLDDFLGVLGVLVGLIVLFIVIRVVIRMIRKGKKTSGTTFMTSPDMGMRGKTKEQKQIVKYFNSTGILGTIFRISDSTFDSLLDRKADELVSIIEKQALDAHGMDADEVKEIPPILVENYYSGSKYFKFFRDNTFRASEYQMTCLMFSNKQLYAYSYIFDLTSANTTEQTSEYFYEDITNVEVTKKQIEFPTPRPMEYIIGGIACIIIGLLLAIPSVTRIFGILIFIAGIVLSFKGFSLRVVDNLTLKITVPGDEFVCAMKPGNITAIQGMKAKIREKKR